MSVDRSLRESSKMEPKMARVGSRLQMAMKLWPNGRIVNYMERE